MLEVIFRETVNKDSQNREIVWSFLELPETLEKPDVPWPGFFLIKDETRSDFGLTYEFAKSNWEATSRPFSFDWDKFWAEGKEEYHED